jgi:hypothetical protein
MSRKRRRSQAVLAEEERYEERTSDADTTGEEHDSEERRKEFEIWDAFKEEHHESTLIKIILKEQCTELDVIVLEQLPLSLHRQYTLIRELDDQSNGTRNKVPLVYDQTGPVRFQPTMQIYWITYGNISRCVYNLHRGGA